jgi:choline dehydrogenase-like flavoprotein
VKTGRIIEGNEVASDLEISCDVCVIGSGSGGAWLAHELVGRGLDVVMLEEGGYHTRAEFDLTEGTAYPKLYQELGNRTTEDLSVVVMQGRSVGGGTTVNWCSSFRTPKRILDFWRDAHGVEGLSEEALSPHWDAIEERLHIAEWPLDRVNANNRVLWDGCEKLGYERGLIRRNVNRCANLGYCGMGCPIDAKQSTLVTVIPDAVEKGLTVYANASARRIETSGRKVVAVHVELLDPGKDQPNGRKLTVRPKVAAVSGGAINSPALLLRSELDAQGRVGQRTWIHPVVAMNAIFDRDIEGWSGAPQSVHSHHFIDRGPDKYGFFLEVPPIHPMLAATASCGYGVWHQATMEQLPKVQSTLALTVDGLLPGEEGGTVRLRDKGFSRLKFNYPLTERHFEAFKVACKEMAKIQFAAGAREVHSLHYEPVKMMSVAELDKLDAAAWEKLRVRVFTAHQMGGCVMGKDPKTSVVDSRLRFHDLDNLFVVDGSVLPSALGVNPQLTIFGLARWASQHVAAAVS